MDNYKASFPTRFVLMTSEAFQQKMEMLIALLTYLELLNMIIQMNLHLHKSRNNETAKES